MISKDCEVDGVTPRHGIGTTGLVAGPAPSFNTQGTGILQHFGISIQDTGGGVRRPSHLVLLWPVQRGAASEQEPRDRGAAGFAVRHDAAAHQPPSSPER